MQHITTLLIVNTMFRDLDIHPSYYRSVHNALAFGVLVGTGV